MYKYQLLTINQKYVWSEKNRYRKTLATHRGGGGQWGVWGGGGGGCIPDRGLSL